MMNSAVDTISVTDQKLYECSCSLCKSFGLPTIKQFNAAVVSQQTDENRSSLAEASPASNDVGFSKVSTIGKNNIDSLLQGSKWGKNGVGKSVSLTYSISAPGAEYVSGYGDEPKEQKNISSALESAIKSAIQDWAAVADVQLTEVRESKTVVGDIRFGRSSDVNSTNTARAKFPDETIVAKAGDVWLDADNGPFADTATANDVSKGTYGYGAILLHEIGHALGLKHPHDDGGSGMPIADSQIDTTAYSVMSYRSYVDQPLTGYQQNFYPTALMLNDIAAIQHLYGANFNWKTGNDVYTWNNLSSNGNILSTIWDAGGNDTIDWSDQISAAKINLKPGEWSELGPAYWNGKENVHQTLALSYSVVKDGAIVNLIENAIGGSGDDELIGNDVSNRLDGRGGSDRMIGGNGGDLYTVDSEGDSITEKFSEGQDEVFSTASFTLSENVENLELQGSRAINGTGNASANRMTGNAENNILWGRANNDTLFGQEGDDLLNGGSEVDFMSGGSGNDRYIVDNVDDFISESNAIDIDSVEASVNYSLGSFIENLTLTGNAVFGTGNELKNIILGNQNQNVLNGLAGDDTLDGGTDNDILTGGTGNDTYFVDTAQDTITELANEGTDTVNSTFNYTLTPNLENLTLLGTAKMGIGNAVDNLITGNQENNVLHGNLGNDTLNGNAGDDRLNGGAGVDAMMGGSGDDEYWVDHVQDSITEQAKEGKDLVNATVTYILSPNIENLTLIGTQAIDGTGNDLDNRITGNIANNTLKGEAGNDTLLGAAGEDQLDGGTGNDQLVGGLGNDKYWIDSEKDNIAENASEGTDIVHASIDYTLKANLENLILTGVAIRATGNELVNYIQGNSRDNMLKGMAGNDTLIGGLGNDELDGGAGDDNMQGGAGDDYYIVDSIYDAILESVNQGIDIVMSSVSYTLSANVEHLTLTGDQIINGVGNDLDNTVTGNQNSNTLQGEAGDDNLIGNEGDDILDGGTGNDTLSAGLGNDTLKSSFGNDKMAGGKGDDAYWLAATTDQITELAGEGTDSIYTSVSYSLSDHLENLILTETNAINGTGNALSNRITGNSAVNYLNAGSGSDWVNGDAGDDYLYGETGDDTLLGGLGQDTAKGGDGNDRLLGDAGNDWLLGDIGNDTLLGDIGKDRLLGGLGDDILTGGDGNDSLFGEAGDDVMTGNQGRDWLWGGAGADRFFCNAAQQGIDTIKDFTLGRDKIVLNRRQLTTLNRIRFDSVKNVQQAKRSRSELTYVRSKGVLLYNENGRETGFGVGGGALVKLNAGLDLQAKDLALSTLSGSPL